MINNLESPDKLCRYAIGIEYDGQHFKGWQRQIGVITIQESLEDAIGRVAAHPVKLIAAGRTDTGVHATGQVAHFDSSAKRTLLNWQRGINTLSPDGVSVSWIISVDPHFNARFSATSRRYRYIIFNRPTAQPILRHNVSWVYETLDLESMRKAGSYLIGKHDFSAFRSSRCQSHSPVREIKSFHLSRMGCWIWFDIEADGFMHHMVRNIAGVLIRIGIGKEKYTWANNVLMSKDRRKGGITASPNGLYLTKVNYPANFKIPQPIEPCSFW